jgi:hypothetical protein
MVPDKALEVQENLDNNIEWIELREVDRYVKANSRE